MNEAHDRHVERNAGRDEDREDDGETGEPFAADAPEVEGDAERDRGQRVAEVVDQVGEESDGAGEREDRELRSGRDPEDDEADRNGLDAFVRADDRAIDESVRVTMLVVRMVVVCSCGWSWSRAWS